MTCLCPKERTLFTSFAPVKMSLCMCPKDVRLFKAAELSCGRVFVHVLACGILKKGFCFPSSLGDKHHQRGPGKQPGDGGRGPGPSAGDLENR